MLEGPNRFFRYIRNIYLNNPKFANKDLAYLRIFFERNIKSNASFASLGQIYSSSKWSAFSKSTIKVSLKQSFFYFVMPFAVLIFFLVSTSGKTTLYSTISSFFSTNIIQSSWNIFVEDTTARLVSVLSSLYMVIIRITTYKVQGIITSSNMNSLKSDTITVKKNKITHKPLSLKVRTVPDYNTLNTPRSFFRVVDSLHLLDQPSFTKPVTRAISSDFLPSTLLGLSDSRRNPLSNCSPLISGNDSELLDKLFLKLESAISLQGVKLKNLNESTNPLPNSSTMTNINLGKQKRWLTKNSVLSNSLVQELFKLTESKKLLGLNLNMSDISNRNIFFSSKNGFLLNSELTNQLVTLNKTLFQSFTSSDNYPQNLHSWLLHPSLSNLNNNETSALFNHKKYYLSNTLANNSLLSNLSLTLVSGNEELPSVLPSTLSSVFVIVAQQPNTLYLGTKLLTDPQSISLKRTLVAKNSYYSHREYFSDNQYNSLLKNLDLRLTYLITSDVIGTNFNFYTPSVPFDFFTDAPKSCNVSILN